MNKKKERKKEKGGDEHNFYQNKRKLQKKKEKTQEYGFDLSTEMPQMVSQCCYLQRIKTKKCQETCMEVQVKLKI